MITKLRVNEYWQDVAKREPLFSADGNVSWCSLYGKQYEVPPKIKTGTLIWSNNSTSGNIPEENKIIISRKYVHSHVHCGMIYNSQDMKTT